jgi:predicted phosphoribosyltransferase
MVSYLGLVKSEIKAQERKTLDRISERVKKYRGQKPFPDISGKTVIITDDGLASGYTMIVACRFLRKKKPEKLIVAVPCASGEAMERVKNEADEVISLAVQKEYPFAVANFYKDWYDVPDEEVVGYLRIS